MKTSLRMGFVLLVCALLFAGCSSGTKTSYSTHTDAMNAFKTSVETGDYKTLATVWADMTESATKQSWNGVTGTSELEYLGHDQNDFNYYKLSYTLTLKPDGSKLGLKQGDSIVWYVTLEKQEKGWMVSSLSTTPIFINTLTKD